MSNWSSTDDQEFHDTYPAPEKKGVDWKKVAITGAAVGLTFASYQHGYNQGFQEGAESVENQQQEEQ